MSKKQRPAPIPAPANRTAAPPSATATWREHLAPMLVCIGYLLIHFIPNLEAYDAMGPQWLYIVILDIAVIAYLLSTGKKYRDAAEQVFGNLFSKLYLSYFALAALSVFAAINPTEFWVCFVRLAATVVAFFNLGILLYGRLYVIKWLAQVIALVLLVESLMATIQFLKDYTQMSMSSAILNIKGTTGNKNIFSAGLIVKIPFVLYCMHDARPLKRTLNALILAIGALTILLANARAAYLSLFLITLLYLVFCFIENRKAKNNELLVSRAGFSLVAMLLGVIISQLVLSAAIRLQEDTGGGQYGNLTDRLGSINTTGSDNLIRLQLWSHAIDYTTKHPLMGCGYGNWKLASIPYIRTMTDDLFVPQHAHNDFLEAFAELGMPGGLLFLSLFVCLAVFTVKTYFSKASQETKLLSVFSLLALVGYSVDAFFNFPGERPINQVFFVVISAINVLAFIHGRESIAPSVENTGSNSILKPVFGLASLLLLLPATYITYQTYQSLIIQRIIMPDMEKEPLQLNYKEFFPKIPSIPNISATAQPMDGIKGRYLSEAGKYDESIAMLDKASKANPYVAYSEFIKAGVYFKQERYDSAKRNALYAFNTRPRAKTYYQTLVAILAKLRDTAGIQKAFDEYILYRPSVFAYDMYLRGMLQSKGAGSPQLLAFADSAYQHFTKLKDPEANALLQRKNEISQAMVSGPTGADAAQKIATANAFYNAGVASFAKAKAAPAASMRKEYLEAADNFIKAGNIITGNYAIYENAGISYFNIQEYNKAIVYFNKALSLGTSTDGKSEYFKGVALYNLGNKNDGCDLIRKASSKGYAEAATILQNNCK